MTNIKQSTSTSKRTKKSYKLKKPNLSLMILELNGGLLEL